MGRRNKKSRKQLCPLPRQNCNANRRQCHSYRQQAKTLRHFDLAEDAGQRAIRAERDISQLTGFWITCPKVSIPTGQSLFYGLQFLATSNFEIVR